MTQRGITKTATLIVALATLLSGGIAIAAQNEAISCNQDGSTLSGKCSDGSRFSLTCTDGDEEVQCDHSDELAWSLCDDQCTSAENNMRPVRALRGHDRPAVSSLRPKAKARAAKKNQRVKRHLQSRRLSDANAIEVAHQRDASLSISVTETRAGDELVVWSYREGDDELRYSCVVGQDCQIFENGRLVRQGAISLNAVQLSHGAHEMMAGLNWEDDIPTDWIDALCTVATGAAFVWPLGTAIAGPTAIGCLIMQGLEEG